MTEIQKWISYPKRGKEELQYKQQAFPLTGMTINSIS